MALPPAAVVLWALAVPAWTAAGGAPPEVSASSGAVRPAAPGREAGPEKEEGAAESGLGRLDLALMLHPYTREVLFTLEMLHARNPSRADPGAVLGAFEKMLAARFRSVTRVEGLEEAASGRAQLVLNLDLHLILRSLSGDKTRVAAVADIRRPDGSKVERLRVTAEKTIPRPAVTNMALEAFLEARDRLAAALDDSPILSALAAELGPAPPVAPRPSPEKAP